MSNKIKVCLVQFEVKIKQSFAENGLRVEKYLRNAQVNNCRIICFPEDFWFGPFDYYSQKDQINIMNCKNQILNWHSYQAKKYNLNIIAGTLLEKINGNIYNTAYIFDCRGRLITNYKKRKLVPYGFEGKFIQPGRRKFKVITLAGIKVGIIICRELFYPSVSQELRKQGVEIIFCPAFWPKKSSDYEKNSLKKNYNIISEMRVVDSLCQARSFENECYFCFVNASGWLVMGEEFDILLGRTSVCAPFFGCLKKLNKNKEGIIIFEYDKNIVEDARKAYKLI